MQLVQIPGGVVRLKDARRDIEREVSLLPFCMGAVPVSAADFAAGRVGKAAVEKGALPATGVTWRESVAWCNNASEREGLKPAYMIEAETVTWNPAAEGYRLPTEAEWVYGSMGGAFGARYGPLSQVAWMADDNVTGPQPVGCKDANSYGLFDTLGNIWEWCWDRLDPARYGDYRVLKGGGWADPEWSCRVSVRRGNAPNAIVEDVGFRIARGAVASTASSSGGQGWSEEADRQRASVEDPLPVGWTPLRY